jgi:hypothetical protein
MTNYIEEIIKLKGFAATARAVGLSPQAIRKWQANGCLPRTEFTGETDYARALAKLTNNKVTKKQLLSMAPATKKSS